MGITGTDVSKEAADMVLTDDNFASIVRAIEEGRGIYDNIQKYLIYLLSTNSGELLTMFAGVMFAGVLGLASAEPGLFLPLLAAQLLWINLVTDGPPALALGIDPKDPDVMERTPRRHGSGVLLTEDWFRLACVGVLMMVGTVGVLDAYYPGGLFTLFATGTGPNAADEALCAYDGLHDADDVPAVRRIQLPVAKTQRLRGLLREPVADRGDRLLAGHACARHLPAAAAERVPYGAAFDRLAGCDGRRATLLAAMELAKAVRVRASRGVGLTVSK